MPNPGAKGWCFTINNWTAQDLEELKALEAKADYIVWKEERGEEGTVHLQGYVEMINRKTLIGMKKCLTRAHLEQRRGTQKEAVAYVKKEETTIGEINEYGTPTQQGERTDIDTFIEKIREGKTDLELLEEMPSTFVRYAKLADDLRAILPTRMRSTIESFYTWQTKVIMILNQPVHPRKIHVFVDYAGGAGKTEMAKYLIEKYKAFYAKGKSVDILYAFSKRISKIVVFDIPRSCEFISWDAIESIKNGVFMTSKYTSRMVTFETPYVFMFMNTMPDKTKLSQDRWDIQYCNEFEDPVVQEREKKRKYEEYIDAQFERN